MNRAKRTLPTAWKLTLLSTILLSLAACEVLDMRRQHVQDRVDMHAGTAWRVGEPRGELSDAGAHFYELELKSKEIYLSRDRFEVVDSGRKFELHLVNKWLTCSPPPPNVGEAWPCRVPEFQSVNSGGDKKFEWCVQQAEAHRSNFLAFIDGKLCVVIAIVEFKKSRDDEHRFAATKVSRDTLVISVFASEGEVGPGVIPSGPRPQYRAPVVE